jgi:hypothetical protein
MIDEYVFGIRGFREGRNDDDRRCDAGHPNRNSFTHPTVPAQSLLEADVHGSFLPQVESTEFPN